MFQSFELSFKFLIRTPENFILDAVPWKGGPVLEPPPFKGGGDIAVQLKIIITLSTMVQHAN